MTSAPAANPIQRAEELLRKMTIEEKAMQLSAVYPMGHVYGLGMMGHMTPETIAKTVNAIQRYLVTGDQIGIPAIFHNEALNGVVTPHFAHFPTAIGLAATWDPEALKEMADLLRRQMRSVGMLQALDGRRTRCPLGASAPDLWRGPLPSQRYERRLHKRYARR